jgi:SAM-dependent methyltransferase
MARTTTRYKIPPGARGGRWRTGVADIPGSRALDYLERNRKAWELWAPEYATAGRAAWLNEDLRWGIWAVPETELMLLGPIEPGADVIELGSGTAAISAWLARHGARPVAVDIARPQLETARALQREFGVSFPLVCENAEDLSFEAESFDLAISEYGASLWCNPRRWLTEANRLLRRGGRLVFFAHGAILMTCTPEGGGPASDRLVRDYFGMYRVEFTEDGPVEFHPTHGQWMRLLHACGFILEDLVEVRPPAEAATRFDFVSAEWARSWPSEEVWIARKASTRATCRVRRARAKE